MRRMNRNRATIYVMALMFSMGVISAPAQQFHVEEKSITDIQAAIKAEEAQGIEFLDLFRGTDLVLLIQRIVADL